MRRAVVLAASLLAALVIGGRPASASIPSAHDMCAVINPSPTGYAVSEWQRTVFSSGWYYDECVYIPVVTPNYGPLCRAVTWYPGGAAYVTDAEPYPGSQWCP